LIDKILAHRHCEYPGYLASWEIYYAALRWRFTVDGIGILHYLYHTWSYVVVPTMTIAHHSITAGW